MNNICVPVVSVVTTVRNGEKYVLKMLESVRGQTCQDFEHIIFDDGSSDDTVKCISGFQKEHPDYRLILVESSPVGRGRALNEAVEKSRAELVAIMDVDDLWHPQKLEHQVAYFVRHPECEFLSSGAELFTDEDELRFDECDGPDVVPLGKKEMLLSNRICHSSVMMRKRICVYDVERDSQYDYELWLRLLFDSVVLMHDRQVLAYHRVHEDQSFECRQGKGYGWRSFKLKSAYCIRNGDVFAIMAGGLRLVIQLLFPRYVRYGVWRMMQKYLVASSSGMPVSRLGISAGDRAPLR